MVMDFCELAVQMNKLECGCAKCLLIRNLFGRKNNA